MEQHCFRTDRVKYATHLSTIIKDIRLLGGTRWKCVWLVCGLICLQRKQQQQLKKKKRSQWLHSRREGGHRHTSRAGLSLITSFIALAWVSILHRWLVHCSHTLTRSKAALRWAALRSSSDTRQHGRDGIRKRAGRCYRKNQANVKVQRPEFTVKTERCRKCVFWFMRFFPLTLHFLH